MLLVVTGIGTLIHVYSTAYMADEPRGGVARFFCYLNLFCFFMLMLVLGNNFLVMFVGWEGVGLCSYLLIGYWYEKKSASDAGKKAFITNRVGDWGFVLGVFLDLLDLRHARFPRRAERRGHDAGRERCSFGVLSTICLLLFVGATGKSAQIPLYVWLPDAMEGPTPVSALIHAATMVTAGVYMLGRNAVLFSHAPMVMTIVAIVGVLTAFMAASIGLVQYDIKRVLAYSTVSQLGYMFTAMGVGRLFGRRLPSDDARLLQGAALPRQRLGDSRHGGRAGHAPDGRAEEVHAGHVRDDVHRHAGDRGHSAARRVLQQGRNPLPRVRQQQGGLGARRGRGDDDGVLHVPARRDDVLRRLSRSGVGDGQPARRVAAAHGARIRDAHAHGRRSARPRVSPRPGRLRTGSDARHDRSRRPATVTGRGTVRTNRRRAMTFPLMALAVGAIVAGLRRDSRRARRRQHDRAVPRAELHGASTRRGARAAALKPRSRPGGLRTTPRRGKASAGLARRSKSA